MSVERGAMERPWRIWRSREGKVERCTEESDKWSMWKQLGWMSMREWASGARGGL